MASTLTVTGVVGPALAVTAQVFTGVKSFLIDTQKEILTVVTDRISDISIAAATTITVTVSGSDYTVTIS